MKVNVFNIDVPGDYPLTSVYTILILKHVLLSWIIFMRLVLLLELFTNPPMLLLLTSLPTSLKY